MYKVREVLKLREVRKACKVRKVVEVRKVGFFVKDYFQPQPATDRLQFQPATSNRQPALNLQPQLATATATGNRQPATGPSCLWLGGLRPAKSHA